MINWLRNKINEWTGVNKLSAQLLELQKVHKREISILKSDLRCTERTARRAHNILTEHTRFAADASFNSHDKTFVIFAGKYRNHDFVQCYYLRDEVGNTLVPILKDMSEDYGKHVIDAPPTFTQYITRDKGI